MADRPIRLLCGLLLVLAGMWLKDVPIPADAWQRWLWTPLGAALILFAARIVG